MNNSVTTRSNVPEWLLKDENYFPQSDRNNFLDKSILSLLNIISKIKAQDTTPNSKYDVNAVFKVAFTLLLVALISISMNFTFVTAINVYLLTMLSLMRARDIVKILRVSFIMGLFTFVIMLPAAFWGNSFSTVMITSKVFASITAVNILSHSTRWSSVTSALKRFFTPDIFIFVFDITIKYIVMLGEFTLNMLYALKLRAVGKNRSKYVSLSGIAGTMFIESKEMSEDMYSAMECRGFTGEYKVHDNFKFTIADLIFIVINIGIIFLFLYLGRI